MLRDVSPPDDVLLVVRGTPATLSEAITAITEDAIVSADTYVIERDGRRELLHGVSVFARTDEESLNKILSRLRRAPAYVEATVGDLRTAGLDIYPAGSDPDHYEVQLVAGIAEDEPPVPYEPVQDAARRLLEVAGALSPNPAYGQEEK